MVHKNIYTDENTALYINSFIYFFSVLRDSTTHTKGRINKSNNTKYHLGSDIVERKFAKT